jgi:NAD+ synthase (glutamine-hydrolysing)
MFSHLGFQRVAAVQPELDLGNPEKNVEFIAKWAERAEASDVAVAVFPELSLTGYTCEDLFQNANLLTRVRRALGELALRTRSLDVAFVVGAPYQVRDGRVFNAAFVFHGGRVHGAVPKTHLPNYGEFYERRWFAPGGGVDLDVEDEVLGPFHLSAAQLFVLGRAVVAVEICEDLWAPSPPSSAHAVAGANLVLNLSASNDLVTKAEYRRALVEQQSARLLAGYAYASSGPGESSKDVVYGGDCLIVENGALLAEGTRFLFEGQMVTADIDFEKLDHERARNATFSGAASGPGGYRVVRVRGSRRLPALSRTYSRTPFVPSDPGWIDTRAKEILDIQATGLARRLSSSGSRIAVLGVSGGLDSTLALLASVRAAAKLGRSPKSVLAVSMPGPGTTERTRSAAEALSRALAVDFREIPIGPSVERHFADIGHDPARHDVVYENAQARERTQILFDLSNQVQGLVVGTGDLSELALGFCTYNADHMASYAVNVSVPKTLVRHLVGWYARAVADGETRRLLEEILAAPSTPELLPPAPDREISQDTEALIGPYLLHDFFLFHHQRNGFGPRKILALATRAFEGEYGPDRIEHWLRVFVTRFYRQQYKRTCLPPGPKVGSVSLSPRGDLRMPDEVDPESVLAELDASSRA